MVVQTGDVEGDPGITAQGVVLITDGTSNTVFLSERSGSTASCSADDTTGDEGITALNLHFREVRTGDAVEIAIVPVDGPMSIPGNHAVQLRVGNEEFTGELTIRSPGSPARAMRGGR